MQLNLLAPMDICAHFMPQMMKRKSGHMVNISSVASWIAPSGLSAYAASKFGLRGFSEAITSGLSRLSDKELTAPAEVMAKVIEAIENNQPTLFPDKRAKQLQFVKRVFPSLLQWMSKRL